MSTTLHAGQAGQSASQVKAVAPGVYCLEVGQGITRSNVFFVRSGSSWALIDTGSAQCDHAIQEAAESLFGANTPPTAILHTHIHPDHAGSTRALSQLWSCPVYVHPDELAMATMSPSTYIATVEQYANPLDTWLILPLLRVTPRRRRESLLSKSSFNDVARTLDPSAGVPGLPEWEYIHTPGHTSGHVSFFRRSDRVLIAGDALLTVNLNSLGGFLRWWSRRDQRGRGLSGPPRYTTWRWRTAKESAATLVRLDPHLLACGHGSLMSGAELAHALRAFTDQP
jgi:glyoxylase-like metal-dependent hydrolase (beta-lactamase superfamily II)